MCVHTPALLTRLPARGSLDNIDSLLLDFWREWNRNSASLGGGEFWLAVASDYWRRRVSEPCWGRLGCTHPGLALDRDFPRHNLLKTYFWVHGGSFRLSEESDMPLFLFIVRSCSFFVRQNHYWNEHRLFYHRVYHTSPEKYWGIFLHFYGDYLPSSIVSQSQMNRPFLLPHATSNSSIHGRTHKEALNSALYATEILRSSPSATWWLWHLCPH